MPYTHYVRRQLPHLAGGGDVLSRLGPAEARRGGQGVALVLEEEEA